MFTARYRLSPYTKCKFRVYHEIRAGLSIEKNSACACKHGCTNFPTLRLPPPNCRRQRADMKQGPCLGSTVLEWTVNLSDLWTLVLSGALCSVHVNRHAFLCERKTTVIMLKLLESGVQNLVALRPGAWELCSPVRRIWRSYTAD